MIDETDFTGTSFVAIDRWSLLHHLVVQRHATESRPLTLLRLARSHGQLALEIDFDKIGRMGNQADSEHRQYEWIGRRWSDVEPGRASRAVKSRSQSDPQ